MGTAELVTIVASVAGAFVGGVCGLGSYMLIIPLMALFFPAHNVILASCLTAPVLSSMLFWRYRCHCRWRSLVPMLAGAVPGTLCGVWIIAVVSSAVLQLLLGLMLLAFLYWQQVGKARCCAKQGQESWPMGGLAGYFGALIGASLSMGGPAVAAYGLYAGWAPQAFLATTSTFFLVRSLMIALTQSLAGLYSAEVVHLALYMIPSCLLGTALSFPVIKRINVATFRALVKIIILLAACSCLLRARELFA